MTSSYRVTAHSAASPEQCFDLIADGPGWPRWAGRMMREGSWEREGTPPPGGVGAIRKLGTKPFYGREEVVVHDPPHHHGYRLLSGQPVRDYVADVTFTPDPGGGTTITWSATFEPVVPGTGRLLAAVYRTMMGNFARRLAAHAETAPTT